MKIGFEITARDEENAIARFFLVGEGAPFEKTMPFKCKAWHTFDISLQAACPFPDFKRHLVDAGIPDRPMEGVFNFKWTSPTEGYMEVVDEAIKPAAVV
jgi:hypothetical protein